MNTSTELGKRISQILRIYYSFKTIKDIEDIHPDKLIELVYTCMKVKENFFDKEIESYFSKYSGGDTSENNHEDEIDIDDELF